MSRSFLTDISHSKVSDTDNELVKCLEVIETAMKYPISWQRVENLNELNIINFQEYETDLGVKLCLIQARSINDLASLPFPVIFKTESCSHLKVFIKKNWLGSTIYHASHHRYVNYHDKDPISMAWLCCPINVPLSVNYHGLLTLLKQFFMKDTVMTMSCGMLSAFMTLLVSLMSGYVFSHLHEVDAGSLSVVYMSFAFWILSSGLINYASELTKKNLDIKLLFFLLPSLWNYLSNLPLNKVKKILSGDVIQRINDYESALLIVIKSSFSVLFDLTAMLILFIYMIWCNPLLAFISMSLCLIFTGVKLFSFPLNMKYQSMQMVGQGIIVSFLNESLLQIHKIRSANVEANVILKWLSSLIDLKIIAEKANYLDVMTGIMESLIPTFFMLSMYVSIYFLSSPDQPYQLLQFIICSSQFFAVANNLSLDMASISYSLPGIKRIESLIGEKLEERQYSSHPSSLSNEITFANIHFKYSDATKFILNDISFHIPQGKFIAFIGTSGAGKSSLFKLMLGLEHPSSGEIHVNGEKINLHNINRIRKQVAAVLQTTSLLPGTIFSNISAHNTLTTEEVWDLARCVALDQEVMRMPMKLYTHISDNASESLSGGQRQKILLARALAMKPKILLLDEATSALDNQSQEHIHSYLQTLNITRIVIAHRLSTIVHADKIYVMDHGKIVDFGTYHELLQRGVI